MDEIANRKKAVQMYLQGCRPTEISKTLKKSRPWFYKWLRRYQNDPTGNWYEERSRRPNTIHKNITPEVEQLVVNTRKQLEKQAYAQIGAVSIQWEIRKLGLEPPPVWTIDRLIKKHRPDNKKEKLTKRKNEYPGQGYANVHQMDLVGPRYIKDYGRVYFLNIIDVDTHCVHINPLVSKATEGVVQAVIRFWQNFGIPDFLQMDNELSFRGSNRHPRSFNPLIRLALCLGVTPIFVPIGEPWRNGVIERFNDTFDKKFFRRHNFENLADIRTKADDFEEFHNHYHRYSVHQNRTPIAMFELNEPHTLLDPDYQVPESIALEEGNITLFRFIRSDRQLRVFGEKFLVKRNLVYCYVKAVIPIETHCIKIYLDEKLVQQIDYPVPVG